MCPTCSTAEESLSTYCLTVQLHIMHKWLVFVEMKELPCCAGKLEYCLSIQNETLKEACVPFCIRHLMYGVPLVPYNVCCQVLPVPRNCAVDVSIMRSTGSKVFGGLNGSASMNHGSTNGCCVHLKRGAAVGPMVGLLWRWVIYNKDYLVK